MTAQTQRKTLGDLLIAEVLPAWSRRRRSFEAGDAMAMGQVLFETIEVEPAGSDPELEPAVTAELAIGVLIEDVAASDEARVGIVIERGAVVAVESLIWPEGAATEAIAVWTGQLIDLGIIPRETL